MTTAGRNSITDFRIDAVLCDSAVTAEGKIYVQGGGWNMLSPPAFPAQLPRIGLAVCVSVPYTATNHNHTLEITLESEDGEVVSVGPPSSDPIDPASVPRPGKITAQFNMGRPPILQAGDAQTMPFAVNVDGLMLASPGAYAFVIKIDDTEMERLAFRAIHQQSGNVRIGG